MFHFDIIICFRAQTAMRVCLSGPVKSLGFFSHQNSLPACAAIPATHLTTNLICTTTHLAQHHKHPRFNHGQKTPGDTPTSVQLRWNKTACLHLIPWQQRQGTFCHETRSCTPGIKILPSDYLKKKKTTTTHKQLQIHEHWFFILDFPDGPVARRGIRDDRFVFPVQTAEYELSNGPTDNINRYQSRITLRSCFLHNPSWQRGKSFTLIHRMLL